MEEGVGGSLQVPAWERQNGRWPAWETCPMVNSPYQWGSQAFPDHLKQNQQRVPDLSTRSDLKTATILLVGVAGVSRPFGAQLEKLTTVLAVVLEVEDQIGRNE